MSKDYGRMEWDFLQNVMTRMGFVRKFVNLILLCVSSVRYFITASGNMLGPCNPRPRFRQGGLLLPYLFILCVKGLSVLIDDYDRRGLL